jgi:hypothetical protein
MANIFRALRLHPVWKGRTGPCRLRVLLSLLSTHGKQAEGNHEGTNERRSLMKLAVCGRCNAELVERPGLRSSRFWQCICGGTVEVQVERGRKFMLKRICLLGGDARISENAVEKFLEKYREGVKHASCNLRESVDGQQRPGSNHADTRAA